MIKLGNTLLFVGDVKDAPEGQILKYLSQQVDFWVQTEIRVGRSCGVNGSTSPIAPFSPF
jgi:hypothetical protein